MQSSGYRECFNVPIETLSSASVSRALGSPPRLPDVTISDLYS